MEFNPVINDPQNINKEFPSSMMPLLLHHKGERILGTYLLAAGEGPHPLVLLLHGFPGNETNLDIAHAIKRAGFNVMIIHYRGSWGSGGSFSWSNSFEDVQFVLDFLYNNLDPKYRLDNSKIIPIGHSMGGFAALLIAAKNKSIKNAGSFGGFNIGYFGKFLKENPQFMELTKERMEFGTEILNGTSPDLLLNEMIKNADEWDLTNYTEDFSSKNILLIAAKFDAIALPELHHSPLKKFFEQNKKSKVEIHELNAGHSFSDSRIKLTHLIIDWLNKVEL